MLKRRKPKRSGEQTQKKPIRLWPGVIAAILLLLLKFIAPVIIPDAMLISMFGQLILGLLVIVWWAFFSRAPKSERWGAVILMIIAVFATRFILHDSMAEAGMGLIFPIYSIPILGLAFVCWAVVCRKLTDGPRRATMVVAILLACSAWALQSFTTAMSTASMVLNSRASTLRTAHVNGRAVATAVASSSSWPTRMY